MICLDTPPFLPFSGDGPQRLPGLSPLEPGTWITNLPDLPAQLDYRARLIETRRQDVIGALPGTDAATGELLETCLAHLAALEGWEVGFNSVVCPGGVNVKLHRADPLGTIGKLVSEDFCILQKEKDASEYHLGAAVLCFPAYWRLADKLGRPLTGIHAPVPDYGDDLARRVNRVFEALQFEKPVVRYNWGLAPVAELHSPPKAKKAWPDVTADMVLFLRVERQTLRRLGKSGAVVFSIRSSVSPLSGLSARDAGAMLTALDAQSPEMTAYKGGAALFGVAKTQLQRRAAVSR
ncbi:MAG: DUF3445 domain-containing protein [Pseudomonadota bacterium]